MVRSRRNVTDAELEVLKLLWDRGPSTIRQLTDRLYPDGGTAHYATRCLHLEKGQLVDAATLEELRRDLNLRSTVLLVLETLLELANGGEILVELDSVAGTETTLQLTHIAQHNIEHTTTFA